MVPQGVLDVVFSLTRADQVELIDRLRHRLQAEATGVEPDEGFPTDLSEEHRRILDERLDELARGEAVVTPWATVEARMLARIGAK